MLILPMEQTFSIRRLPIATVLLLVVNVIVYFVTAGRHEAVLLDAVEAYEAQDILETELPLFQAYLRDASLEPEYWQDFESADAIDDTERVYVVAQILVDPEYAAYLERDAERLTAAQRLALEDKREIVAAFRARDPYFSFGFVPAEFSLPTLFSSQFLHGGLAHLIGNLVILVLVGLTVEQLLGSFNYTLFYLLSGAFGALLHGLVFLGDPVPMVGASGAISGLMGMYVAAYGKRPIRFFYWIGFYFNYARLPALVMLPVWVGKEIFDFVFTGGSVAYIVHAGGLVAGAGLVYFGKSSFARIDADVIENRDHDREYREDLEHALRLVDRAEFPAAREALMRLLARHPGDLRAGLQLVRIAKARPATKDYHRATYDYLKGCLASGDLGAEALGVVRDYWRCAAPEPRIGGPLLAQLINKLIAKRELGLADELVRSAKAHGLLDAAMLQQAETYRAAQQGARS